MAKMTRFGRKLAIPSTRQIRHELLMAVARDEARLKAIEEKKRDAEHATLVGTPQ